MKIRNFFVGLGSVLFIVLIIGFNFLSQCSIFDWIMVNKIYNTFQNNDEEYKKKLNDGLDYFDKGEQDKALQCFEEASKLNPDSEEAKIGIARIYMTQKKSNSVINILKPLYDDDSEYPQVYESMGFAYVDLRNCEEALNCFNKALSLKERPEGLLGMGNYYLSCSGNPQEAMKYLTRCLQFKEQKTDTWIMIYLLLSSTYTGLQDFEKGLNYGIKAEALLVTMLNKYNKKAQDEYFSFIFLTQGICHYGQGNKDLGMKYLMKSEALGNVIATQFLQNYVN